MTSTIPRAVRLRTEERLRRLAWAGEVLIDGELFKGIVRDPAVCGGDDYRVNEENFIPIKRMLFKIRRLEREADASLVTWRRYRCADKDGHEREAAVMVVPLDSHPKDVKGVHSISPAMERAFRGHMAVEVQATRTGERILSVYAPIRDSFEDVVGVSEVFAALPLKRTRAPKVTS